MEIRSISLNDLERLKEIHAKYFEHEFPFPDFMKDFHCVFTVTDDSGNIITSGGVRSIAESVIITDKDYSIKERREALIKMLQAHSFIAAHYGFDALHAFIQDNAWKRHLSQHGFRPTVGQSVILPL